MVYIKPSTRLRTDYSQIAELARRTGDAIYITRNGEKDLVVMCARAFELRDLVLKLSNVVLESENTRRKAMVEVSIRLLPRAVDDLKNIGAYWRRNITPNEADRITGKILRDLKELKLFYPAADSIKYEPLKSRNFKILKSQNYIWRPTALNTSR